MAGHGKLLVRHEPHASVLQEALEGFASGRFDAQVEVKRFLERQPDFPKDLPNGEIRNQRVKDILTRPIYAGFVEVPKWNVSLRKGHHEGLITFATFEKIQSRLREGARAPARKDINEDFPLRGFIRCGDCDKPLTACWSKSKTGRKHPYYLCYNKACVSNRKSIPRDRLEGEFEGILKAIQPTENLFSLAKAMFKDAWNQKLLQTQHAAASRKKEAAKLQKQIDRLLERIVETDNASVITAYENRIAALERQKLVVNDDIENRGKPKRAFDEMFELAFTFLSNPWNLLTSDIFSYKSLILLCLGCQKALHGLFSPAIVSEC
ncbi:recombinase zinc beta ribbon domain-containing protein [Ruegeria sp.]|uniref:recombinase zinc beta ribbon domain-containing protein n=1 Tax=Ruegeria sp. TaxID=1879320 RepID=UPI003B001160